MHSGLSCMMFAAFQVFVCRHPTDRVCNHGWLRSFGLTCACAKSTRSTWTTSITTILPSMVRTHECSCPAPTQHAQTSDSAIVASHSVGNLHDGTYVDTTCPTEQLGIITTFSTNSTQCSSTTHSAIPTTSPLSTDTTVSTDPTLLTHDNDLSVATTLDQPFTFWSTTQGRQERSHHACQLNRPQVHHRQIQTELFIDPSNQPNRAIPDAMIRQPAQRRNNVRMHRHQSLPRIPPHHQFFRPFTIVPRRSQHRTTQT